MTNGNPLVEICEQLSAARRAEVVDFARFLLMQEKGFPGGTETDTAWEQLIGDTTANSKLEDFAKAALAEGSEPMDPETL